MRITNRHHSASTGGKAAFAWLICGLTATCSAQLVDIPTVTLVQDTEPVIQPPAAPTTPAPIQPSPSAPQADPLIQSPADGSDQLNVDPNASIEDLVPPTAPGAQPPGAGAQAPLPAPTNRGRGRSSFGTTRASFASAPNLLGDFFGGGLGTLTGSQSVFFQEHAIGRVFGIDGDPNALVVFEFGGDAIPNDLMTMAPGLDTVGGGDGADTFGLVEPVPPSSALTSPGPGFLFDSATATAVYTNSNTLTTAQPGTFADGQFWFINYSYTRTIGQDPNGPRRPITSPGVGVRRVKVAENFSPEVRDRAFFSYSFFNDAFGGLGDISRYVLGVERILVSDLVSIDMRLPMAGTYGSSQNFDAAANRDFEIGNAAFILKGVLLRSDQMIWTGGLGVTVPSADNTLIQSGGQNIVKIKNESVHLLPFSAFLWRKDRNTSFQFHAQVDVVTNGDPIFGNLAGGPLPRLGVFSDATLMHLDAAVSHTLYRNRRNRCVQEVIANGELHYSATLQESDFVSANGLTYTNLKRYFNVVNATMGAHLVMSNNIVVSPAMSIPLRSGLDEQFDYEAQLQLNYLR